MISLFYSDMHFHSPFKITRRKLEYLMAFVNHLLVPNVRPNS